MKGKILIIEDDINWQEDLKEYLEIDGFFVKVVSDLETAIITVNKERFHFITVDMELNPDASNIIKPEEYEGWGVLEEIKKLRIQDITPVMVITGHGVDYNLFKKLKKVEALFFMEKGEFDKQKFLEIINAQVKRINLRFKDDHRDS